ncbi:putative ankyrin repeat protein RF_0381 [Chelonus insularis]|uniref:putative ankyrin repeat protein RF_0381 n=1 Tax=Chelonus insularis TaxID=460826 RepID=UPI00158B36E4|nr:putative ankyrin repeat protein RF_0381 [Chelonus insularis]
MMERIALDRLYLSRLSDVDSEVILITATNRVSAIEQIIPVKLEHPNHFGFLQFHYKGPGFCNVFSLSSVKVSGLLLIQSNTEDHEVFLKDVQNNITEGDWNIIHIDTKNESDCHYLFEKSIEDNCTVIFAMKLMIVDANDSSRQLVLYLNKVDCLLLCRAIKEKDMKMIKMYLNFNLDINARNEASETPLHVAVDLGMSDVVDLLISNGADVNASNEHRRVPLHSAVINANSTIFDILIKNQAKLNEKDDEARTPLHYAVDTGNMEFVNILLKRGANCNLKDSCKNAPLHLAVEQNNLDMIKAFLNFNLDINARNNAGETPLHVSVKSRKKNIVDLLISNGADVNASNKQRQVPLHSAVKEYNLKILDTLLKNQVNFDKQDREGQTPLHLAVGAENLDAVDMFLKKGVNYKLIDAWDRTPLHLAAERMHLDMIKVFLDNNVDPNIVNSCNQTPLHVIDQLIHIKTYGYRRFGNRSLGDGPRNTEFYLPFIITLLEKGADLNFQDKGGNTPYNNAVKNGRRILAKAFQECECINGVIAVKNKAQSGKFTLHVTLETSNVEMKIIQCIVKATSDIDAKDERGRTALHIATINHLDSSTVHHSHKFLYTERIEYLLRNKANINAVDNDMSTPLHHACRNKNVHVVEYLIEKGADPRIRDKDGKTVLHYACMMDWRYSQSSSHRRKDVQSKIISILVKNGVSVNWDDKFGKTPLHYVVEENDDTSFYLYQLLLQNGADINIEDNDRDTAFDKLLKQHSLSKSKKVAPFIHHVIKMKVMEKWVLKKTLDKIYEEKNKIFLKQVKNYEDNCNIEINAMKKQKIGQSDITFYDFLKTSPDDTANYAQNQNIVEAIESNQLKKRFPIYNEFLKCHLREIQQWDKSSDQTQESLNTFKKKKLKL